MRSRRGSTGSRSASAPTRSKARVSRSGARSTTSPTRCRAGSRSRPTRTRWPVTPRSARTRGVVPIVEPEVLMDGGHTIERCAEVTEAVLHEVFDALHRNRVVLEHMLLKPSMVVAGKEQARQASAVEVAAQTVRVLRRSVPAAVPGIFFLSGGQTPAEASAHLDAINRLGPQPWALSFLLRARVAGPGAARPGKGRPPTHAAPKTRCSNERD